MTDSPITGFLGLHLRPRHMPRACQRPLNIDASPPLGNHCGRVVRGQATQQQSRAWHVTTGQKSRTGREVGQPLPEGCSPTTSTPLYCKPFLQWAIVARCFAWKLFIHPLFDDRPLARDALFV
mmetsp:Transcript_1387/g.3757  ORF Transcript_1387/g.3757 Transcript_1387/m.3757 type:complete len:123 (-) Transcript_1387:1116-1484(-)|eukprot:75766-Chlamydomonas_euryale.AAC.2